MNFMLSLSTVLPILVYMLIGAMFGRAGDLSSHTQGQMNKIIFKYFFPFVMFNNIYKTNLQQALDWPFLMTMLVTALVIAAGAILLIPRFFDKKPVQGSMIQGVVRGNSILFALPVVTAISGPQNTGLVSLCIAVLVPVYNIICVVVLESLRGEKLRLGPLLRSIMNNPIILGALAGLASHLLRLRLPAMVTDVVGNIAAMVTPLALIMLGAGLKFADTLGYRRELVIVSVVKLLVSPLLYVLPVKMMGFGPVAVVTALAIGAVPTAVSSFVMAKEMDADALLAGQIVAVTTVLSVGSVFLWVLLLSGLGWIG